MLLLLLLLVVMVLVVLQMALVVVMLRCRLGQHVIHKEQGKRIIPSARLCVEESHIVQPTLRIASVCINRAAKIIAANTARRCVVLYGCQCFRYS